MPFLFQRGFGASLPEENLPNGPFLEAKLSRRGHDSINVAGCEISRPGPITRGGLLLPPRLKIENSPVGITIAEGGEESRPEVLSFGPGNPIGAKPGDSETWQAVG